MGRSDSTRPVIDQRGGVSRGCSRKPLQGFPARAGHGRAQHKKGGRRVLAGASAPAPPRPPSSAAPPRPCLHPPPPHPAQDQTPPSRPARASPLNRGCAGPFPPSDSADPLPPASAPAIPSLPRVLRPRSRRSDGGKKRRRNGDSSRCAGCRATALLCRSKAGLSERQRSDE